MSKREREHYKRPAEDADDDEEWEDVDAKIAKTVDVVLSVRLTEEVANELRRAGREAGIPASRLARHAIERYLADEVGDGVRALDGVSVSTQVGTASFYAGGSRLSQTSAHGDVRLVPAG